MVCLPVVLSAVFNVVVVTVVVVGTARSIDKNAVSAWQENLCSERNLLQSSTSG